MFQRPSDEITTGVAQILNLIKRTDNVAVKSEGTRVIVNIIKTLWLGDNRSTSSEITSPTVMSGNSEEILEKQQKRQTAIRTIIASDVVSVLTGLIARSRRHPVLVNEAIIALSLLSTTKDGGNECSSPCSCNLRYYIRTTSDTGHQRPVRYGASNANGGLSSLTVEQ